jgi:hypothetical protein
MAKRFIDNRFLTTLEIFDKNILPSFIQADATSSTGYFLKYTKKTYIEEKPADIPENIDIKLPIADKDFYIKTGTDYKVFTKSEIENNFTEI